jgi:hypothetical protein
MLQFLAVGREAGRARRTPNVIETTALTVERRGADFPRTISRVIQRSRRGSAQVNGLRSVTAVQEVKEVKEAGAIAPACATAGRKG